MAWRALVTSGPTHEQIDPVRFLSNPSSGKQGHAIASALAKIGFEVTLITGPTALDDPKGMQKILHVKSAEEMLNAALSALPVDVAVCAAAVGDWYLPKIFAEKIKKTSTQETLHLTLERTKDILATLAQHETKRPRLVVGFAAETENTLENAEKKRRAKNCDWILANHITKENPAFAAEINKIFFISAEENQAWKQQSKTAIAEKLATKIQHFLAL